MTLDFSVRVTVFGVVMAGIFYIAALGWHQPLLHHAGFVQ